MRTGWVVGHLGLLGAWLVIGLAFSVSIATTLSLSSIVSNIRVGAGGAFSLLTRTLGIEPGGSIGLPLYLSQALAIPMYVFGFREGWLRIFPEHPAWAIDTTLTVLLFAIASVSARLAFRLQYGVLAVIGASVLSIAGGLVTGDPTPPTWWRDGGTVGEVGLVSAFSVFFPAVTGIMAGLNMSGELATPRRSIVRGTAWAVGITLLVYLGVAAIAAVLLPGEVLRTDTTALTRASAWGPLVLAGLLSATFSSALSTVVGAPRILAALGSHGVVPAGAWVSRRGLGGQPHRALAVTAVVVALGVALRDLNTIAPLITLFFLVTYGAINLTLLLQQALQMPQFRTTVQVPLAVPAVGALGCGVAMVLVSPAFTAVALAAVAVLYLWLLRRAPEGPFGQARAGTLVSLFGWLTTRLESLPTDRAWQAHVLAVPHDAHHARALTPLLRVVPEGLEEAIDDDPVILDLVAVRDPTHPARLDRLRALGAGDLVVAVLSGPVDAH